MEVVNKLAACHKEFFPRQFKTALRREPRRQQGRARGAAAGPEMFIGNVAVKRRAPHDLGPAHDIDNEQSLSLMPRRNLARVRLELRIDLCGGQDIEGLQLRAEFQRVLYRLIQLADAELNDGPLGFLSALKTHRPTVAVPGDDINPVLRLAGSAIALKRGIGPVNRVNVGAQFLELLPGFRGRIVGVDMNDYDGGEGPAFFRRGATN